MAEPPSDRDFTEDGEPCDTVATVLTGHLLKDPGILVKYHQETHPAPRYANRPIEIEASVAEVERVLASE